MSLRFRAAACAGPVATAVVLISLTAACGSLPRRPDPPSTLILVSIDGFRWDYRERGDTPVLDRLAQRGVSAGRLVPVFPTKTFPNHFTIVTGLYPEHHGLVANNMYDPEFEATYRMSKRDEVANGRWYDGEPIWVNAERKGIVTAPLFWPGSEAEIGGVRPTFWVPFDGSVSNAGRVDALLALLDRRGSDRPRFLTLYFNSVDDAGHRFGPHPSPELRAAVEDVDAMIGRLVDGLRTRGLVDRTDIIVVSDHGMAASSRERVILLDRHVDLDVAGPVDWDPVLGLWPVEDSEAEVYRQLVEADLHWLVYRRAEVPPALHYSAHRRIPPIVAIAEEGWAVTDSTRFESCTTCFTGGAHGFDPQLESMGALFIAAGPSFARGRRIERLGNIHLYELMCAILGIEPAPNDGDGSIVAPLLRPR